MTATSEARLRQLQWTFDALSRQAVALKAENERLRAELESANANRSIQAAAIESLTTTESDLRSEIERLSTGWQRTAEQLRSIVAFVDLKWQAVRGDRFPEAVDGELPIRAAVTEMVNEIHRLSSRRTGKAQDNNVSG